MLISNKKKKINRYKTHVRPTHEDEQNVNKRDLERIFH